MGACLPFELCSKAPAQGVFALPVSVISGRAAGVCKPGRPLLRACAYLSACVLDLGSCGIPGETAEKTSRSEELNPGRSGAGKSVRRNLVIRITTARGNRQHYQEWPQTNRELAAGKFQGKSTAGQEKWCD